MAPMQTYALDTGLSLHSCAQVGTLTLKIKMEWTIKQLLQAEPQQLDQQRIVQALVACTGTRHTPISTLIGLIQQRHGFITVKAPCGWEQGRIKQ